MVTSTPFAGTTADTASAFAGFFGEAGVRDVRVGGTRHNPTPHVG
ncbi:hypothetical protein [Streptomyces sp. NPDC088794]